ncbi:MAG: hypothetical protein K0S61_3230 [Anaerocolumna sp.]|jgi:uncharacterized protein YukJ|nr:hypothetical protein [Anaerocolumna sp.]
MPIENYGVLKGIVLDGKEERNLKKPHYQIHVQGEMNREYRVAVNVMSRPIHPEVLYLADEDFQSPLLNALNNLEYGFTPINNFNGINDNTINTATSHIALDYIRGNIIQKPEKMKPLPHDLAGEDNDLNDFFNNFVEMARNESTPSTTIYVFGSKFISYGEKDEVFHFSPPIGIHNVHMNQGNDKSSSWSDDNGIWQDGGIFIHTKDKWIAIFLAFLTQSWCTDRNGYPLQSCSYLNATMKRNQETVKRKMNNYNK